MLINASTDDRQIGKQTITTYFVKQSEENSMHGAAM